jgi:hypothetical protein
VREVKLRDGGFKSEKGIFALPPAMSPSPEVDVIVDMEEDHNAVKEIEESVERTPLDDGGDMEDVVLVEDSSAGRRFKRRRISEDEDINGVQAEGEEQSPTTLRDEWDLHFDPDDEEEKDAKMDRSETKQQSIPIGEAEEECDSNGTVLLDIGPSSTHLPPSTSLGSSSLQAKSRHHSSGSLGSPHSSHLYAQSTVPTSHHITSHLSHSLELDVIGDDHTR